MRLSKRFALTLAAIALFAIAGCGGGGTGTGGNTGAGGDTGAATDVMTDTTGTGGDAGTGGDTGGDAGDSGG